MYNEFNFNSYGNSKQTISYCEVDKCPAVIELREQLDQLKEQIKYQNNFIDSLLKATNNSEWFDKSILDDEAGEIIEKIELDYAELDQLKAEIEKKELIFAGIEVSNKRLLDKVDQLKAENEELEKELRQKRMTILMNNDHYFEVDKTNRKLKQTLTEIKEIAEKCIKTNDSTYNPSIQVTARAILSEQILQKISEVEDETSKT